MGPSSEGASIAAAHPNAPPSAGKATVRAAALLLVLAATFGPLSTTVAVKHAEAWQEHDRHGLLPGYPLGAGPGEAPPPMRAFAHVVRHFWYYHFRR